MLATTVVGRFCPPPLPPPPPSWSLNLLTQHHSVYPVGSLLGGLLNHDQRLVAAYPFLSGNLLHETAVAVGPSTDDPPPSPMNLSTAAGGTRAGQQFAGDAPSPARRLYLACSDPVDRSAAVHGGVGVFQRLLTLMSRRASVLDGMQRMCAASRQPSFGSQYPDDVAQFPQTPETRRTTV